MAVYVVTGGAGFIGSNLVEHLLASGEEVRVVDDFSSGSTANLEALIDKVALFKGDICEPTLLRKAFKGADFVLHQAAVASVQKSVDDPVSTNRTNVEGTLRVLEAAAECGIGRVVFASSCAVYGNSDELPLSEKALPQPLSPYAAGKLAGEHYCRAFGACRGLQTACLRYFNVFGPRQDPEGPYAAVIPKFIEALLGGGRPVVFGDGEQSRDFVYVDDVAEANLLAARRAEAAGEVFNVGSSRSTTLNELLEILGDICGAHPEPVRRPARPGEPRRSLADIAAARTVLGYEPAVPLAEGLRRTVEWFRERRNV